MRAIVSGATLLLLAACANSLASTPGAAPFANEPFGTTALGSDGQHGICPQSPASLGLTPDGDFHGAPSVKHNFPTYFAGHYITNTQWQVTTGSVDIIGGKYYHFPYSVCSADLDGTPGVGGIAHDPIPTTSGTTYSVGFDLSGNGSCAPTVKTLQVSAAGQSMTYTWDTSRHNDARHGRYAAENWQFQANGLTVTIVFQSLDAPSGNNLCGPVVANIGVTPL